MSLKKHEKMHFVFFVCLDAAQKTHIFDQNSTIDVKFLACKSRPEFTPGIQRKFQAKTRYQWLVMGQNMQNSFFPIFAKILNGCKCTFRDPFALVLDLSVVFHLCPTYDVSV